MRIERMLSIYNLIMLINISMTKDSSEIEKDSSKPEEIPKSIKWVKKSAKKSDSKIVNQKVARSIVKKKKLNAKENWWRIFRPRRKNRN